MTIFSGDFLLELVKNGTTREEAYAWVQESALAAMEGVGEFVDLVCKHPEIRKRLTEEKIKHLSSLHYHLRNVEKIYEKVLN
jgi:adenylosuccinate lyase